MGASRGSGSSIAVPLSKHSLCSHDRLVQALCDDSARPRVKQIQSTDPSRVQIVSSRHDTSGAGITPAKSADVVALSLHLCLIILLFRPDSARRKTLAPPKLRSHATHRRRCAAFSWYQSERTLACAELPATARRAASLIDCFGDKGPLYCEQGSVFKSS